MSSAEGVGEEAKEGTARSAESRAGGGGIKKKL